MTKQEAFDRIALHLAEQGRRSISKGGTCFYRGPEGRKCAIGCLISDEAAQQADKSTNSGITGTWNLLSKELALEDTDEDASLRFYRVMQEAHDHSITPDGLRAALMRAAETHKLDPEKVNLIKEWQ